MKKTLADLLFVFLGLPVALSALFLVSVRPLALDRETYRRFVEDDRLYSALQAPEMAARAPKTISIGPAIFDGPALTAALQKSLPVPELKETGSRAIDAALGAAERGVAGFPLQLDLKPLKAALRAKGPAMARDYAAALAGANATAKGPDALKGADAAKAIVAAVDALPDTATAQPPAPGTRRIGGPIGVLSRGPDLSGQGLTQALLNRMTATTAAAAALLLAGLGALGGTGLVSRLSRAGRYLLVPSALVLALGVVLAIPGGLILQNVLPRELQGMIGGAGGAALKAYLASALGPVARAFFVTGLVGASLGGVLAQARRFAEPKELE